MMLGGIPFQIFVHSQQLFHDGAVLRECVCLGFTSPVPGKKSLKYVHRDIESRMIEKLWLS
jgi:hypothetical protein